MGTQRPDKIAEGPEWIELTEHIKAVVAAEAAMRASVAKPPPAPTPKTTAPISREQVLLPIEILETRDRFTSPATHELLDAAGRDRHARYDVEANRRLLAEAGLHRPDTQARGVDLAAPQAKPDVASPDPAEGDPPIHPVRQNAPVDPRAALAANAALFAYVHYGQSADVHEQPSVTPVELGREQLPAERPVVLPDGTPATTGSTLDRIATAVMRGAPDATATTGSIGEEHAAANTGAPRGQQCVSR